MQVKKILHGLKKREYRDGIKRKRQDRDGTPTQLREMHIASEVLSWRSLHKPYIAAVSLPWKLCTFFTTWREQNTYVVAMESILYLTQHHGHPTFYLLISSHF